MMYMIAHSTESEMLSSSQGFHHLPRLSYLFIKFVFPGSCDLILIFPLTVTLKEPRIHAKSNFEFVFRIQNA